MEEERKYKALVQRLKGEIPLYYDEKRYHWSVQCGDDLYLPNVCDCNCDSCVQDAGELSPENRLTAATTLENWRRAEEIPDERQSRAEKWYKNTLEWPPKDWQMSELWLDQQYRNLARIPEEKTFNFTGRGDPLFYVPVISKILDYFLKVKNLEGYTVICTSGTLMDEGMRDFLCDIGVDEIILNPPATHFHQLKKIEMIKKKMKVSVNIPLLPYHCNVTLANLQLFEDLGISTLILPYTEIYSLQGLRKMENALYAWGMEDIELDQSDPNCWIVDDQGMADTILDAAQQYTYSVLVKKKQVLIDK